MWKRGKREERPAYTSDRLLVYPRINGDQQIHFLTDIKPTLATTVKRLSRRTDEMHSAREAREGRRAI